MEELKYKVGDNVLTTLGERKIIEVDPEDIAGLHYRTMSVEEKGGCLLWISEDTIIARMAEGTTLYTIPEAIDTVTVKFILDKVRSLNNLADSGGEAARLIVTYLEGLHTGLE